MTRKICMIVHQYPPDPGATAYRMAYRAGLLHSQGYEVDVFAPGQSNQTITVAPGFRVHRVPAFAASSSADMDYTRIKTMGRSRLLEFLRPLTGFLRWLPPLILKLRRFDGGEAILYTYNNPVSLHLAGLVVRKRFRSWVCEFRDPVVGYEYSARGFWGVLTDGWLQKQILRHANVVCMRRGIQAGPDDYVSEKARLVLLPDYGIDLNLFSGFKPKKNDSEAPVGIYAGTVFNDMSFASLSSGLSLYRQINGDAKIHLFGPDNPEFHEYANLTYGGNIGFQRLLDEYQKADYSIVYDLSVCQQGRSAGFFPSKLAELIAVQRPILLIGNQDSVAAKIITDMNIGVCTDNVPAAISEAISAIAAGLIAERFELSINDGKCNMIDAKIAESEFVAMLEGIQN